MCDALNLSNKKSTMHPYIIQSYNHQELKRTIPLKKIEDGITTESEVKRILGSLHSSF